MSGSLYNALYSGDFAYMQYLGDLRRHPNKAPDVDFNGLTSGSPS